MTVNAGNLEKGVDRSNLDFRVSPGENFYQYACGGWQKANPLDPQYARFGTFDQLGENSREQVKDIITNLGENLPKGTIAQKVSDLYLLGMDVNRLNADGANPLKADLAKIDNAKRSDFMGLIKWLHLGIASPFFGTSVMADMKNSNENMFYIMQGGLGMGDRDYYLENDANTTKVRNAYANYIERLFVLAGYKKGAAKKAAKNVMKIETDLARVAMTREETLQCDEHGRPETAVQEHRLGCAECEEC